MPTHQCRVIELIFEILKAIFQYLMACFRSVIMLFKKSVVAWLLASDTITCSVEDRLFNHKNDIKQKFALLAKSIY